MESEILKWLNESGFPFEMRLARSLAQQKFKVTQSAYYRDFETKEPREIDLLARLYGFYETAREPAGLYELETFCAIECKASPKPWVVFKETAQSLWRIERAMTNDAGRRLFNLAEERIKETTLDAAASRAGHNLKQAHCKDDSAFKALMAATKAAEGKIREMIAFDEMVADDPKQETWPVHSLYAVLPIIAVTAPLFECVLSETGAIGLKKVEASTVAFQYPRAREEAGEGAIVHIVTEGAWPSFMEAVSEFHDVLKRELPSLQQVVVRAGQSTH